jgi:hypothetical protein
VLDHERVAEIRITMAGADFAALVDRLPKEIDIQAARFEHAIRANDIDGVRVAFRALRDLAADFGLQELADLSARLAAGTVDLDRALEQSATIQDAVGRAKGAIEGLSALARDTGA